MDNNLRSNTKEEGIRKPIRLPITHNFTLFLIGVIVVGLVAYVSYTYLNLISNPKHLVDELNVSTSVKYTNNYDIFDPDGTLSDLSVNQVFKNWLKTKRVGYEYLESGHFSSDDLRRADIYTGSYCDKADSAKKFVNSDKTKVTCFFSGEEPDSSLYVEDQVASSSQRLSFCGTPCMYETGFWLTTNKFVFLWTYYDMEYDNNNRSYKQYMVDIYDFDLYKIWHWSTTRIY